MRCEVIITAADARAAGADPNNWPRADALVYAAARFREQGVLLRAEDMASDPRLEWYERGDGGAFRVVYDDGEPSELKPWPGDAIILVAPLSGTQVDDEHEPTTARHCRDCRREVTCRESSIRVAHAHPARHERPIDFICTECCLGYDRSTLDTVEDCRR